MTGLFQESDNDLPLFEDTELQSKFISYYYILQSKNKSLFLNYTPQRTLQSLWYLVQVELSSTSESNINAKKQGIYY